MTRHRAPAAARASCACRPMPAAACRSSTWLAARVREILHDPRKWRLLPEPVRDWLRLQQQRSALPDRDGLLVETFPRGGRWFMVAYCFEGRLAHQTLGMLVTKRMERLGYGADRLPRHRLCHRHLVGLRADRRRAAVRGGHPRRGPRGLDGRELHAPPHLPQHRHHRRADREEPPGPGEIRPPDDHELRPDLRRAAQARARPRAAARHPAGSRRRADRRRPHRPGAGARARAASATCGSTASRRSPCRR